MIGSSRLHTHTLLCVLAGSSACLTEVAEQSEERSEFREAQSGSVRNAITARNPEALEMAAEIEAFTRLSVEVCGESRDPEACVRANPELAARRAGIGGSDHGRTEPRPTHHGHDDDDGSHDDGGRGDDGSHDDGGRGDDGSHDDGGHDDGGGNDDGGGGDPDTSVPGAECDLPYVPRLLVKQCSGAEAATITAAYQRAHYNMWRFHQLLEYVLTLHHDVAEQAAVDVWTLGEDEEVSLSFFFGTYDIAILTELEKTVRYVRENYLTHDASVTFACHEGIKFADLFKPKLFAAKLASPCTWDAALAHSAYIGLPFLHPNYSFPTYEVCDEFFTNPTFANEPAQGMILSHEFFHWLENDFGVLKDRFKEPECEILDPPKECRDLVEYNALALAHPELEVRNVHAYGDFGWTYSDLYMDEDCDSAYCFDSPWCPAEGDGSGAPPIPADCIGEPLGSCEMGPCAPIEQSPSHGEKMDPFSAAHPDGDFSKDTYCEGKDLVCARVGDEGRCLPCGPGQMLGCPCDTQAECEGDGLGCWGSDDAGWPGSQGYCWDPVEGPPPFQCDEGCTGRTDYLGNDGYYCYHDTGVVSEATCVHTDCADPDASCINQNVSLVCMPGGCLPECAVAADCGAEFGWPAGTVCAEGSCQPPMGP